MRVDARVWRCEGAPPYWRCFAKISSDWWWERIQGIITNASKVVSAGSQHFGVHPLHCQCMKYFKRQDKEREECEARKNTWLDFVNHASKKQQSASLYLPTEKALESFVTVGKELVALTTPQDIGRLTRTIELTRTTVGHNLNQVLRALRLCKQWRAN